MSKRLDEIYNMAINAKQMAIDTASESEDIWENAEMLIAANTLLDTYRGEFKSQIKALVLELIQQKINIRVSEQFNQNDLQKVVDAVRADLMNKVEAL